LFAICEFIFTTPVPSATMLSIVVAVLCMLITWNAVLLRRVNEITAQMAENVEMVARLKAGYGDSIEKTNKTMHILTSGVKAIQAMVKDNSVQVDNIMESFSNIHLRMAAYENSIPSVSAPAESVINPDLMDLSEYLKTESAPDCAQPDETSNDDDPSE